ncbi:MAG TPA: hypothetical protein VFP22_10495, partial [Candidatus Limnocylindrales bacterium]|nr:hypothetical protein [Candidatus Limnocylindrales bacterium]
MPDGLLLFAFALTLVANAVLIVVAIRAMRSSPANEDAERGGARDHERSMSGGPVESPVGPSSRDRVAAPAPLPTAKVDRVPVRPLPLAPPPPSVRAVAMA